MPARGGASNNKVQTVLQSLSLARPSAPLRTRQHAGARDDEDDLNARMQRTHQQFDTRQWCDRLDHVLRAAGHWDCSTYRTVFVFAHEPECARFYFNHLSAAGQAYLTAQLPHAMRVRRNTHADDMQRDPFGVGRLVRLPNHPTAYISVPVALATFWTTLRADRLRQAEQYTALDCVAAGVAVFSMLIGLYWFANLH